MDSHSSKTLPMPSNCLGVNATIGDVVDHPGATAPNL